MKDNNAIENSGLPPPPFIAKEDGIYREVEDRNGAIHLERICSPIQVIGRTSDGANSSWGKLVKITDPAGQIHRVPLDTGDLAVSPDKALRALMDRGLELAPCKDAKTALVELLRKWTLEDRHLLSNRLGWPDNNFDSFILGNGVVLGNQRVLCNRTLGSSAHQMTSKGELQDWREHIAGPCLGNPVLICAVSLAFAGPLLEPLESPGLMLHLRGGSSSGKTTALQAALSVWGGPSLLCKWRATTNGLEGLASERNGTLLALDELGLVTSSQAGEAVYTIADGHGKARADKTGTAVRPLKWRVAVLSSGEISLAEKLGETGQRSMQGQEVRLIDIAVDTRAFGAFDVLHGAAGASEFADRIKMAASAHHGIAGALFVECLLKNRQKLLAILQKTLATIQRLLVNAVGTPRNGREDRVFKSFAQLALAGELASAFKLTGWPTLTATNAAIELLETWVDSQSLNCCASTGQAIERVQHYLKSHASDRLQRIGGSPVTRCQGHCDENFYYLDDEAWSEIHGRDNMQQAARLLHEAGLLVREGTHWKAKPPRAVEGRPRCYKLRAAFFQQGTEAPEPKREAASD